MDQPSTAGAPRRHLNAPRFVKKGKFFEEFSRPGGDGADGGVGVGWGWGVRPPVRTAVMGGAAQAAAGWIFCSIQVWH